MKSLFTMTATQQREALASPQWRLQRREAFTLRPAAQPRWLRVVEGELWLTRSAADGRSASEDCWLRAGERLQVPAGAEMVIEAWTASRFELLLQATGTIGHRRRRPDHELLPAAGSFA